MPTNILRGDAPVRRQVLVIGPPAADQLTGRFTISINGKSFTIDGWSSGGIVTNWPTTIPEFAEITPVGLDTGGVQLTGPADGTPFDVSVQSTAVVTIAEATKGESPATEVQRVTLPPATGGTFTLSYGAFTSAAIAYNATAAQIQTAISPISTAFPGVTATVTGPIGGPFDIAFVGGGPGSVLITINATNLTGATSVSVSTIKEGEAGVTGAIEIAVFDFALLSFSGGGSTLAITPETAGSTIKTYLDSKTGATWTVTPNLGSGASYYSCTSGIPTLDPGTLSISANGGSESGYGFVSGTIGSAIKSEVQRVALAWAGGGTFTLTYSGETTGAIPYDAPASSVKTALEALTNITTVTVIGTPGVSYDVRFDAPSGNVAQMTATSSLTPYSLVERTVDYSAGVSEVQTVTLPGTVTGGTFVLSFNGDRSTAIAYNASAATVDTALEGIEDIGSGGVTVLDLAPGSWRITFTAKGDKALLVADAAGLTVGAESLLALETPAGGPTHWNDPLNWTLDRPPESGDTVWLDQPGINLLHSLRQRTGFSLDSADKDTLIADGAMHFAEGQKITLRTTNTLPGGLSAQDYYVVDPDAANRTFKVSTTRGGSPVNLTSGTGTGTHTALVELDAPAGSAIFNPTARFSGRLGLPRRNPSDYWEYRPLSLAIGVRSSGSKLVRIGAGDGPGSGRLKLDLGSDAAEIRVVQTGGSAEGSVPACLLTVSNNAAALIQHDGDSGLAFFPEDTATIGTLDVRGGTFSSGDSVTIEGAVTAVVGSVRGHYLDAAGTSHRWE